MDGMIGAEKSSLFRAGPRLLEILAVLRRHKLLGALRGSRRLPPPGSLREAFEELGITFLKFGQVLAMRGDMLPVAYTRELNSLHDQLPAMGMEGVRATVEAALGATLEELFSSFDPEPLAAATIAQVHEATLPDGRHVAVKVQRPGLSALIATDIRALTYLVGVGSSVFPSLRPFELGSVVAEFADSLHRELDFRREARSIGLFRAALADVPNLWIPGVVPEYSTETVLTLEFSAGERIDLYAQHHPEAMPQAVDTLVALMLHTIFEEGIFHADPHPGNVFVLPDGRLSLLDFGNTGELDERMRKSLVLLLEAIVRSDAHAATEAYLEMITASEQVDQGALTVDIKAALYAVNMSNLAEVSIGDAFESLLRAGSQNGVRNPAEFLLLARAFVILESVSARLSPGHDYTRSFREEISRLTSQRFSPDRIVEQSIKFARETERLLIDGPGDMRRVLRRIAEGDLGRLQAPVLEVLGTRLSRNLDHLTVAMASGAMLVGGSLLLGSQFGGWHHILGEAMVALGLLSMLFSRIGEWLRERGRR